MYKLHEVYWEAGDGFLQGKNGAMLEEGHRFSYSTNLRVKKIILKITQPVQVTT